MSDKKSDESFEMSRENGPLEFNSQQYRPDEQKDSIIEFMSGDQRSMLPLGDPGFDSNRTLNNQTESNSRPCLTEHGEESENNNHLQLQTQTSQHNFSMMKETTEEFVMKSPPKRKRTAAYFRFNPLKNLASPAWS